MMSTKVLVALCVSGLGVASSASVDLSAAESPFPLASTAYTGYPSTYPYEDESYVPPDLPESSPSYTFDDSDPGGYTRLGLMIDLNEYEFPWGYHLLPALDHYTVKSWSVTIFAGTEGYYNLGVQQWNCSAADTVLYHSADDFLGELSGTELACKEDGCCSDWIGLIKGGSGQIGEHELWGPLWSSGGCDYETMTEEQYCGYVDGTLYNCVEYWVSETERTFLYPCPDGAVRWWMSCSVYKVTGLSELDLMVSLESPLYIDEMSPEQTAHAFTMLNFWDRQCAPYSYYNPDSAVSGVASLSFAVSSLAASITVLY